MAHGTLSRDHEQRVICALPAGIRPEARLTACRFPNAPWRIAILGGRPTTRLTIDESNELTAHVTITGFVRPVRDDLPTTLFHPSIVAERLVLPLDHPALPGNKVSAHRLDEDGNWQEITTIVGEPVNTTQDAPYRVHRTDHAQEYHPAREDPESTRQTAQPTETSVNVPEQPTQRALLQE